MADRTLPTRCRCNPTRYPEHELLDVEVREVRDDGLAYFSPHKVV